MADLKHALLEAGLNIPDERIERLNIYHEMLLEWNEKMDLTSVSKEDMAARHFLDSLMPLMQGRLFPEGIKLIDVGTGAGFPGLPLAIARPDMQVTLLEAQGKRCQFLSAVCQRLELANVEVINDRAEVFGRVDGRRESYDRAVARAVAPLNILCEYLLPFVKVGGMALCWKGPAVAEEQKDGAAAALKLGGQLDFLIEMAMPGKESGHVLAVIQKTEETIPQYPRKNGIPAKRPLKADKES
ncbi:MAG: 16S rRNA (guanine(527)-N(7))-methyltransferase RsmG [Clostridiales bacterium]|nr:16S rRNA (guanine(527)-N(7))-methyltransferase RsmG [Clostridiales bacterium]